MAGKTRNHSNHKNQINHSADKWAMIIFFLLSLTYSTNAQKVSTLEYFWNTDPGFGQATIIPITPDSIIDINFSPTLAGLELGINTLYVRAQNDSMRWGFAQRSVIYVYPNIATANASTLEYFIDTDPGLGFGAQVPIPNSDNVDISFNVNVQNLTDGLHTLYVRAKNSLGDWSFVQRHTFMKLSDLSSDITQLEYFIDTDPGLGNGTQVAVMAGQEVDVTFNVNLSSVSQGLHTLYIRSRKANGLWSFSQNKPFLLLSNTTMPKITDLEYYYDIDPGYGNGRQVSIMPADSVISISSFSLSGLTVGTHKLYIRAKDENNHWSHIFVRDVAVTTSDNLYPEITILPTSIVMSSPHCSEVDTQIIKIVNSGSNPLNVNLSESASWLSIYPLALSVAVGDTGYVNAIATPSPGIAPNNTTTLTFTTNDPLNPTVNRSITYSVATSAFDLELSTNTLIIPPVQVNKKDSAEVLLTNLSCSNLSIDTIIHTNSRFSTKKPNTSGVTTLPGYTYLGMYNGHTYFKSNGTSTWLAAESSINTLMQQQGLNGYLLSINSASENAWILPLTQERDFLMGLRDHDGAVNTIPCEANTSSNPQLNCWQWSDGTTVLSNNFQNWIAGEPNNSGNEDFGHFVGSTGGTIAGLWNDLPSTSSHKHILEVASGFPPSTSKELVVNFESNEVGQFIDTMFIMSNAGIDTVIVYAEALGVPVMEIPQDSVHIEFEACAVDTSFSIHILNNGFGPLNCNIITSNLPSWLTAQLDSNNVAPGFATNVTITFTNPTLTPGTHLYIILIQTNDTITPIDTIKLQITVGGDSSLIFEHGEIVFDTIDRNTSVTFTTKLINNGCSPVFVSDVSFGSSIFAENVSSIYLPPYNSYPLVLKFQPPFTDKFYDTLVVTGNIASGPLRLPVEGLSKGALTYQLSKLTSNVTIQNCDGMTMDTLYIKNVGDGEGTWAVANKNLIPSWLYLADTSGVITAGDSAAIIIGYDATGLINNNYSHSLRINLSDPQTPYITLPASMYVVGGSLPGLSKDTLDFGLTYFTTVKTDTITITNMGCDTFHITGVDANSYITVTPSVLNVLPDSSAKVVITYTPAAIGMHEDTIIFMSPTENLFLPMFGQSVQYPTIIKATKDSLSISMPAPIDLSTLNSSNWVVWGEQSGKRSGNYSVSGNQIHFIPAQPFFAGEEINLSLTNKVQYTSGLAIEKYSILDIINSFNITNGTFSIEPTNISCNGCSVIFNEMNNDGNLDIISVQGENVKLSLRNSKNNYNLISNQDFDLVSGIYNTGDLNSDGINDIIAKFSSGASISDNGFKVLKGNFNNGFDLLGAKISSNLAEVLFGDLNVDGSNEIVVNSFDNTRTYLNHYNNQLNGVSGFTILNNQSRVIGKSDFNKNGLFEILTTQGKTYEATINNNLIEINQTGLSAKGIISKMTLDEVPDFVFQDNTNIRIRKNLPNSPLFGNNEIIVSDANLLFITDFNGDGTNDILFRSNDLSQSIGVGFNNGQGSFTKKELGFSLKNASVISPADLDNDGDLDFAYLDAQGKLWIAYNEDNTADMSLSQYAIVDTFSCGDSITVPVSIRNTGTSPLVWQQDATGGTGNTLPSWLTSSSQYSEIPTGDSLILNLKIKTTGLSNGSYNFNYIINSNDSENYKDTVAISVVVQTDSSIMIAPLAWDFGLVDTSKVYTQNFVINNTSCQPITFSATFKVGGLYSVSGLTPNTIAAFSSKTIAVNLNPNALTDYKDTLILTHSYGVQAIPLTAQGCFVSPVTMLYEQVCLAADVRVDSMMLQNVSGCDSLVVTFYQLPGINQSNLKLALLFNGNANDLSGNNNHGVVTGATLTADRHGNLNSAFRFQNNGDKIIVPSTANVSGSNPRSISFWLKHEGSVGGIFTWGNYSSCNEFAFGHFKNNVNTYRIQFWDCDHDVFLPNSNLGWHHYVLQYANGFVQLYYDGVLMASLSRTLNTSNSPITLGLRAGQDVSIQASLDDVVLYSRTLSQTEILDLYNSQIMVYNNIPTYVYETTCDSSLIGLDTTILAGTNYYGCDSTIITQTSLQLPISNEGLVAYYPFDGNAQDRSGLGNNGTVNGAVLTTDRFGNANKAYSFDGNDWSESNTSLSSPTNQLTISAWVKTSNSHTNAGIAGRWNDFNGASGSGREEFVMHASATGMNFSIKSGTQYNVGESSPIYNNNQWHHYVGVYNGSNIRLFRDGVLVNTVAASGNINTFAQNFEIGRYGGGVSPVTFFNGRIEDVQLYNRALTDSEIQSLYFSQSYINTCIPSEVGLDTLAFTNICGQDSMVQQITSLQTPVSPEKLVAYYPFSGNASDMSGWGSHGVVNGATLATDRFGNVNGAYSFDGVNDLIQISNPPKNYNKELTVSWWVNANSFQIGSGIGQSSPNVNSSGTWLMHGNVDRSLAFFVNDNGTWRNTPNSAPLGTGWQHIVGTAKADSLRLYINGNLVVRSAGIAVNILNDLNSVIHVGKDVRYSSGRWLNGSVDEVLVLNRALSQSEIQALYTNTNTNYTFNTAQTCDPLEVGMDTMTFAGAAQNGCDSFAINTTSLKSPVSPDGLVAYYTFDGNSKDMSGFGNNGVVNGAILTTDQFDNPNRAYAFDGNDEIVAPLSSQNFNNKISISLWSNPNAYDNGQIAYLSKNNTTNQGMFDLIGEINGGPKTYLKYAGKLYVFNYSQPLNVWTHLSAECDNIANTAKLYVNGVLHSSVSVSSTYTFTSTYPLLIGANTQGTKETFRGRMTDIFIFNRNLSANEINQLYRASKKVGEVLTSTDSAFIFSPTMVGATDTILSYITNNTCDTITIDAVNSSSAVFTASLAPFELSPFETKQYNVFFTPTAAVPYAGQLTIRANGRDTLILPLSGSGCALCTCPTQDVVLRSQADVDQYVTTFGGCDTISVNFTIDEQSAITNISSLSFLKQVNGNFTIQNTTTITNLSGFQGLHTINGNVLIRSNAAITSLLGLQRLKKSANLTIEMNNALVSTGGLDSMNMINGSFTIRNNTNLVNCQPMCYIINGSFVSGTKVVTGNPAGCSSLNEVNIRCSAGCPNGNYVLTTQAEVDAFVAAFGTCDSLIGNLTISGANITALNGLSFIKYISGTLTIQNNSSLTTLTGLQGLTRVGGSVIIQNNNLLWHIDQLSILTKIGLDLTIQNNNALVNVFGLTGLDSLGRKLTVKNNPVLSDCQGLCTVMNTGTIVGAIEITNNPSQCSSPTEVIIRCRNNDCPSHDYILRTQLEVNAFVASFADCDSVIGNLTIEGGTSITDLSGLSFIKYIGGSLVIRNNFVLTSLQGFNNLQRVNVALRIEGNSVLTNMSPLKRLKWIGNEMRVVNNNALVVLAGLDSVTNISTNFILTNNTKLTDASQLCRLINTNVVKGAYTVSGNPSPVSSINEISATCIYGSLISSLFVRNLPDSIEEGSILQFRIAVDHAPIDTVAVTLSSSIQVEVPLPTTVFILPGDTSVNVQVQLPNDFIPEKDKMVTITAGAPFLLSGTDQFILIDHNDVPSIELIINQTEIPENAGLYAVTARVRRLGATSSTLNVTLESNNPGQLTLPTGINILAGESEKSFFIGVLDNGLVEGSRTVNITASAIINSCVCPAPVGTQGVSIKPLIITDDDGPSLTLSANNLSMSEGKLNAAMLTITRNTPTNAALTVNLNVNDTTELILPSTVTIPIGTTFVNVPINTKADILEDGNQEVTITASSAGFANGVIWVIVSDINKPDLVIASVEALEDTVKLGDILPFKVYIHNKGLSGSARGVNLIGYLSNDNSISADDHVIGQYFLDISILAGDTIVYGNIGSIPNRIGNQKLIFRVNPNETITELLYINNTSTAINVHILPNYSGTAVVDSSFYYPGQTVTVYGSALSPQNIKLGNTDLDLIMYLGGIRRKIAVKTNTTGDYNYVFTPTQSDVGRFTASAVFPNAGDITPQDTFDVLGVRINNGNFITWNMLLGDTLTGSLPINNPSGVAITTVTLAPVTLPNGCVLRFDTIALLNAFQTTTIGYTISANVVTAPGVYQQFPINVRGNQRTLNTVTGYYSVTAKRGHLTASLTNINTQINNTQRQQVAIEITNTGAGLTGEISVEIPTSTWMRLVSPATINSLAPGDKATITMEFIPSAALPLNTPATGTIAINSTNANNFGIPFRVMKVSDATGTMNVDVINQFTYFSPGAPHLDSARVRISNYFTGQLYADGLTNANGIFTATNLPEGQLRIVVDARRHKSYDGLITVNPGQNATEVVFLEYQAISFSWDVIPTEIEDEYEIDLIMNFEANVPVPVIVMTMPEILPKLNGSETFSFFINLTNKGLITANEVKLDLPIDPEYELVTTYQPQDILPQRTYQVPVLMRRRTASASGLKSHEEIINNANERLNIKN